ncbi:cytochrome b [Trinickia terrae]|uniref:Cytochrome b n=1 Tax=Trinickia terrae TaxID=2571161 RepID=A0A4U1I994_9BURK|nr:cytochrome b [Trinickia terrae]TKC90048.1 cytochrome b [Trinickia terrae]
MVTSNRPAKPIRYGGVAVSLHWMVGLLMICGFYLGWIMTDIPGFTPTKLKYFSWHKWIGVTVFALAVIRLLWRFTHRAPPLPDMTSALQRAAAHAVHGLLYLLMLAISVSGYLYSSAAGIQVVFLGLVPLPTIIAPDTTLKLLLRTTHVWLNYTLLLLFALHMLASIKHHFIERDGILGRMTPFLK